MAFSLAKLHEAAVGRVRNLTGRLEKHKGHLGTMAVETLRTGIAAGGGASAALIDHYMGTPTDALPEAMVGPVPVVITAALLLKGAAYVLTEPADVGSFHFSQAIHEYANGLGAAGTYATVLRALKA
jgi:hypothetical protein